MVAFSVCSTQWSVGGLGHRTGLRYADCIALLERYLPRWQAEDPRAWGPITVSDLLEHLQVIESAVLGADAERAKARASEVPRP